MYSKAVITTYKHLVTKSCMSTLLIGLNVKKNLISTRELNSKNYGMFTQRNATVAVRKMAQNYLLTWKKMFSWCYIRKQTFSYVKSTIAYLVKKASDRTNTT